MGESSWAYGIRQTKNNMETQEISLQGIASLVFVAAGTQLSTNVFIGVGLVILAMAILILKAWLAKQGIAAKGR